MTSNLSRRGLLGGIAATGALTATGALPGVASAAPKGRAGDLPSTADVVVVGAGISGLVAAREVAAKGRSVVVLEARDRVGGRILNHELAGGSVIEAGGAFVGPTQDHILGLCEELGIQTFKEYTAGSSVYLSKGIRQTYQGTIPPDPLILPDAGRLQLQLDEMSKDVPVDAPWLAAKAAEWDSTSLHDWVAQNTVNPDTAKLLEVYLQPLLGADARDVSLLFMLWYLATAGNERNPGTFERSSGTENGAQDSRIVGGSQLIPLRMAERLGDIVALSAPVRRIEHSADRAVVTTDRGEVSAGRVIVATPPPLITQIDWAPLLPPKRMQLLQRHFMGALMKCDAVYDKPFWRDKGLNGFGISDVPPVRVAFDNSPADGSPGVLLAFVGGATWAEWGSRSLDERRQGVLEGFARLFGDEALDPIEYTEQDWTHERWSYGGPVANPGLGATYRFGDQIRRPVGRVHWAGTETSTYWAGYMDGAVRAGKRAAAEVTAP